MHCTWDLCERTPKLAVSTIASVSWKRCSVWHYPDRNAGWPAILVLLFPVCFDRSQFFLKCPSYSYFCGFLCHTFWREYRNVANFTAIVSPLWHSPPMLCRGRINVPAYGDGRKRENCSVWKYCITVACRRSVQFGCYITLFWMAYCASVMTKMLPLSNFTIPCRGRRAWKTSHYAHAFAGSRFWLVWIHSLRGPCPVENLA